MVAVPGSAGGTEAFELGVQTHFSQGWDLGLVERFDGLGANAFRDGISWEKVEATPGLYDLASISGHLEAAARRGLRPLLVFAGSNPLFDDDATPHTDEGRQAFARYVAAVVAAYPDLIRRIEVGNEYNTPGFLSGPFEEDPARYYALLIREVAAAVRQAAPETQILCSGAHSVATGYFRELFEHGALESCDAISFHPYRDQPENVDVEIERLRSLMREFGTEKPLYATEFGKWFDDPAEAPDFMLKMVSLMGDAGVEGAFWYALLDQPWWPNMGLIADGGAEMPAASAYRFLQKTLLPLGRPVRRSDDPLDRIYEFGSGGRAFVVWGAPGELVVEGDARFFNASGQEIEPRRQLSDAPVVVMGDGISVAAERERSYFSSFYQYGREPWAYVVREADGGETQLAVLDWNWNPFLGHASLKPLAVTPQSITAVTFDDDRFETVERFVAPVSGSYEITAQWNPRDPEKDQAEIEIRRNSETVGAAMAAASPFRFGPVMLSLEAGDSVDFAVSPSRSSGSAVVRRKIEIIGP
jgi:hypothetical protein